MRLHIAQCGAPDQPALVLLHGWAMHSGIFAAWAEQLKAHFSVYLVDLPGYGHSGTIELELLETAALLASELPPALWCGWSLGGSYAVHAALHAKVIGKPALGVAMLASSPCFVARENWLHGMEAETFARFAFELSQDWRAVVQRFLALEAMGSSAQADDLRWLQAQVFARGEPSLRALQQGLDDLARIDLRAVLPQLDCPSVWLAGARDRLVKVEAMQHAAALCKGSYQSIARAGHAPFLHESEVITAHLTHLLDSVSSM